MSETDVRPRITDGLRRAEWTVAPIDQDETRRLIEGMHYAKGCPNTSVARHGLFRSSDMKLLGVAMWLPPTKNAARTVAGREWRNVLALTRFVVAESVPLNGETFLLGASMRLVDRVRWPWLLTYADSSHGHVGTIYKATNWTYLGPWDAGDTWVNEDGEQRGRKRGKRNLSVVEMREQGFEKAPAAVKHKFVHHVGRLPKRVHDLDGVALDEVPVVADVADPDPRLSLFTGAERPEQRVIDAVVNAYHPEAHGEPPYDLEEILWLQTKELPA